MKDIILKIVLLQRNNGMDLQFSGNNGITEFAL